MKEQKSEIRNPNSEIYHVPVLLSESIEGLKIKNGGVYVDATYGGGGHAKTILEKLGEGKLFAFDQDADAVKNIIDDERLLFVNQNFRQLKKMLRVNGINEVDGILADLGVSSHQIDEASRGFAHRFDAQLDMRMDQHASKTAHDVINRYNAVELQRVFGEYGEVRNAKTLAIKIEAAKFEKPIQSIEEFISVISTCIIGNRNRYLSQVFQALRIEVNDELNALQDFLEQSKTVLKKGGRMVVISYHSLEDRLVKNFIRNGNAVGEDEKDDFGNITKYFLPFNKKPIEASEEEIKLNPRARSAKLRIAEKI